MKISKFVSMPARELAAICKVREETLSKYFNGHRNPNYSTVSSMSINLNMSVEEVMKGIRLRREQKQKLSQLTSVQK